MKPIVFLGPSLARDDAAAHLDAEFRPPAAQGDVMRAVRARPPAIGLIDGIFKDAPTVRHRELLWAMSEGIPVYGAASMGALRAAELWSDGMIGVGLIYRWYRRYPLLPDDAVAVTHTPTELGARPLSDALVDIRRSLSRAERKGLISRDEHRAHRDEANAQSFPERRLPKICDPCRTSQKAADAIALLDRMALDQEGPGWPKPSQDRPPIVHAWLDDLADSGVSLETGHK